MQGWKPYRTRSGNVIQSGLNPQPMKVVMGDLPPLAKYKAIVTKTYVSDDSENFSGLLVECDVILVTTSIPIPRVPVLQSNHGINNVHNMWVPKPTTRSLEENGELNFRKKGPDGAFTGPVTSYDQVDGDMVIVEFLEGDKDSPAITAAFPHRRTNRVVVDGTGWSEGDESTRGAPQRDEYYSHHQGTELRINQSGDVLVDTRGAYSDLETEDPETGQGQIRMRLKEGQKFTVQAGDIDVLEVYEQNGEVHIDLGENATEQLVRGNRLVAWVANHIHPTGTGPTVQPNPISGGETVYPTTNKATFLSGIHKVENDSDGTV